jgi:hypothetical protein
MSINEEVYKNSKDKLFVYFEDETFYLMFAIDNNKDLVDYSASKEYMGSNDDLINYLVERNPNMTYDQADTLISHYIENEIIPNLP